MILGRRVLFGGELHKLLLLEGWKDTGWVKPVMIDDFQTILVKGEAAKKDGEENASGKRDWAKC